MSKIASLLLLVVLLPACCRNAAPAAVAPAPVAAAPTVHSPILAKVNGVPITKADVDLAWRIRSRDKPMPPQMQASVVQTLLREELLAQQGAQAGLDADPELAETLGKLEAQLANARRRRLSELYLNKALAAVTATEAEARKVFDDNAERIRVDLHLNQLLFTDEAKAAAALAELRSGKPFAEVARATMPPNLPAEQKPWELSGVKWKQVPEPWLPVVYRLKPGDTSDPIRGPGGRIWILQLLDKTPNNAEFADLKVMLMDDLKMAKTAAAREELDRSLLAAAKIERPAKP